MTQQRKEALRRKLQEARIRLLMRNYDFAEPLLEMLFVAVKDVRRMSTNETCIYFDPAWVQKLSDFALDFALAHQLMHIRLDHTRRPILFQGDRYHLACDIVANARLRIFGLDDDNIPGLGKIYSETFFPRTDGGSLTAEEAFGMVPFDPSGLPKGKRDRYMIDDETWWDRKDDRGENGEIVLSPDDREPEDLACQVEYRFIEREFISPYSRKKESPAVEEKGKEKKESQTQDAPGKWDKSAAQNIRSLRNSKACAEQLAAQAQSGLRRWHPLKDSRLDWKEVLQSFVQDMEQDYFFTPPDRRYAEADFFLPDFRDNPGQTKQILFYVDTSGSICGEKLSQAAAEICGAIEASEQRLEGILLFFDTRVYPGTCFSSIRDIRSVAPSGGGGTDFCCVFKHAQAEKQKRTVSSVVIFTDADGTYPDSLDPELPILWVVNNKHNTPPFGTVIRI